MKRFGLSILTLLTAAVFATGCSSSNDTASTESGNNPSDGGEVTLSLWHPEGDMSETYKQVIEQFNEEYEGEMQAEITFIPRGNKYAYEDKISAGATSNTLPDLVALDGPNVANYAEAGIIQPIDGLVENQDDFVESIITQGTFNGNLYTVGPTESTVALFYNVKMLEEAGITPPSTLEEAWTWDEFYEAAKALTDKENDIYGVNWTLDYGEWIIYFTGPTVWSNGGSFIAEDGSTVDGYVNGPKTVEALEYLQKFTTEGLVNLQPTPTEFEEFQKSVFYKMMVGEEGRPVWISTVERDKFVENENLIFSQGRVIKDINNLSDIGYLILDVKLDRLDEVFKALQQPGSQEMIVNLKGEIVYSVHHQMIGESVVLPNGMEVSQSGTIIDDWDNEKSLISFIPIQFNENVLSDYFLISVKPWSFITNETRVIRYVTIFLVILVSVFVICFKQIFLNKVIHFITDLQSNMKKIERGQLNTRMKAFSVRELNHLAMGFNRMVEEISTLLSRVKNEQERKRKAEFKVLQNQINPHFLYNTLESINSMAVLHGSRDISKMTINLGKLLRISINTDDKVTIGNEVRHVISYMEIQNVRFNKRFTFKIEIDKQLEHDHMLKLVLQPLVENILIHAFDRNKTDGVITIRGGISNSDGFFFIEDNGVGIAMDVLATFNRRNQGNNISNQNIGCGVMNVQERIKLFYGERYGLMICSEETKGTTIKLTFPLSEGEQNDI